jgi:hypothetical protein
VLPFDEVEVDGVIEYDDETLVRIEAFIHSGEPHQVMTPNPEFVSQIAQSEDRSQGQSTPQLRPAAYSEPDWVVRAGVATPQQLKDGVAEHALVPDL